MTRQEEKRRLRRTIRGLEERLSPRYLEESGRAIAARLLAMPEYRAAGTVFCFAGVGREVDTRPILEHALAAGKVLCVPLCTGPGQMELRQIIDPARLSPGAFGILEPPADSPAVRSEYYDRFLARYRGGTVLLCRERLIREEIPVEPHDYPVPWVLTERGLYEDGVPARLG